MVYHGNGANKFNLIKTKPGTAAEVGDTVIRCRNGTTICPTGNVFKVLKVCDEYDNLYYEDGFSANSNECKVLVKYTVTNEYVIGSSWKDKRDNVATTTKYKVTINDFECSEVSKHHVDIKSFKDIYNTKVIPEKTQMKPLLKVGDVINISKVWAHITESTIRVINIENDHYYFNGNNKPNLIQSTDNNIRNGTITIVTPSNLRNEVTLPTQHKETTMVTPQTVEIKVNGKDILCQKHESAVYLKPKTDFEARKQYTMVAYGVDGEYLNTKYYKTEKQAKKARKHYLNLPEHLGQTVTLHKECCKPMTTSVPLIEV